MALLTKFLGKYHSFHWLHRPHRHSWDSSTFTEAQWTQSSPFDHRTQGHTPNMDGLYSFINDISQKLPLFSPTPPPPHTFSGLLHFYWGTTNPTQSVRLQNTPPIWTDRTLRLYGLINDISRKLPLFSPTPHTFSGLLHIYWGTTNPTQSVRPQNTSIWTDRTLHLH